MLFRVILDQNNIQRLDCPEKPSSLQELKDIICQKLEIAHGFTLQFEDPAFDNQLCNLTDISYLPEDKATLKVFWEIGLMPVQDETVSDFNFDTASVSSGSTASFSQCQRSQQWPASFTIPTFSYDLELRLRKGNEEYEKSKSSLKVSREMKIGILEKIAESMYTFSAYPSENEYEKVAKALVLKHPCLIEPGPGTGWQGWKVSLKFKMANYRQKLRSTGCSEVKINKRQRGTQGETLKKPKRAELNFLPDYPIGVNEDALEAERMWLEEELKKKNFNVSQVNAKMDLTFSLRRREVVSDQPPVSTIKRRWPALFLEEQVYAEFKRITGVDLHLAFHKALEVNAKGLIRMYQSRRGDGQNDLNAILNSLDEQTTDIAMHRRSAAIRGLQFYLRENESIVKTIQISDDVERQTRGIHMGILETVINTEGLDTVVDVAVVVEEEVLLKGLADVPTAFGVFFGLFYALNLQYPK
nr:uncharacterized protein LOC129451008 [Misgurnus anguillicaudatus]